MFSDDLFMCIEPCLCDYLYVINDIVSEKNLGYTSVFKPGYLAVKPRQHHLFIRQAEFEC